MSWRDGLTEIKYVDPIKSDDWRNGLLPVGESAEPAGETARENNRAAMRRTTAGREDDWLDIGRKFFERLGPNLKAGIGGAVQGIIETAAATPPSNAPLTSSELYDFNKRATEGIKAARELGVVPGQKLYADAARDLQDNAYRPGNTGFKKYIPMVAESVVQMAPAVAASIASRNPNVGGVIMGAQVAGQQYGESAASGRDTGQAFQDAVFMGAAEAIGEKIPIGILMKPGGKFLSSTLKAAGAEGLQEMFTQALQTGYDMGRLNPDMTWGEAWAQIKDAGIVGALTGGSINVAIQGGRLARDGIRSRPVAAGKREQATASGPTITPEDEASPIPTETIAKGKAETADAMAKGEADTILSQNGTPGVGKRVSVKMPDGTTKKGTVSDAFDEDVEGERASGIKIDFDDGTALHENFGDLADAGVEITEDAGGVDPQAYSSQLDQALAEAGIDPANPTASPMDAASVTTSATDPERDRKPKRTKGTGTPIANAKQLTEALFPGARVTSWKRDPKDKLTQANPTSWHAHGGAAVDVAPIKDMTFEQFVQKYRDAGYSIIEALNETGAGKSKHATGDHWHIVLGTGGRDASNAPSTPAPTMAAEDMGFGQQAEATPEAAPEAPASTGQEFLQAAQRGAPIDVRYEDAEDVALTAKNRGVPVKYGVVELGSLVASNDLEGRANPNYPQALQPRDRTRAVSQAQIAGIAANLNPRLLSRSPKASDGTPIIAPDGIVESGNGRTIALQRAYAMGGANIDAYKAMIQGEGFDINGMQQPVLVRVRQGEMSDQDVLNYTAEANARETLGMSGPEQAMADARALTPELLDLFREGDIDSVANFPFRKAFLQKVVASSNEFSELVTGDGQMSQKAIKRVHGAFLAAAYENSDLVNQAVEATDTHIRTVINALTDVAGAWAQLRAAIRNGDIDPAMDITANLNEAVQLIDRARREGKKVGDLVNQSDIFSGDTVSPVTQLLLKLFFDRPDYTKPMGRARLVSGLRTYIDGAMKAEPAGSSLFGDALETISPKDVLETAKRKQTNEPESDEDLFAAAAQPASDAGRTEQQPEPARPVGGSASDSGQDGAGRTGEGIPQRGGEPDQQGDVKPEPVPGPVHAQPKSDTEKRAVLGAISEGRGANLLTGAGQWALESGLAAEGVKRNSLFLTDKGEAELARLTGKPSASPVEITENASGKSITIKGASAEQLAQIRDAIPNAKPLEPKSGGVVYSKKYEKTIRDIVEAGGAQKAIEEHRGGVTAKPGEIRQIASGNKLGAAEALSEIEAFEDVDTSEQVAPVPAKPKEAPEWVAFPANLKSAGVPRADMPQIKAEHRGALTQFLKARGVEHSESLMLPRDLTPTQAEYSPAKVEQAKAYEGGDRAILVGNGGRILDGHHQWMAALETAQNEPIRVIEFDAPIRKLIELANEFPSSTQAEGANEAVLAPQYNGPEVAQRLARDIMDMGVEVSDRIGKMTGVRRNQGENPAAHAARLVETPDRIRDVRNAIALINRESQTSATASAPAEKPQQPVAKSVTATKRKANENPYVAKGDRIKVMQEIPGEYVRAGETYVIESASKDGARFTVEGGDSGTIIRNFNIGRALASGAMVKLEQEAPAPEPSPVIGNPIAEPAKPSPNKIVTDDRAAELRERLKAKLNGSQLNAGIDPEVLAIGAELAVYHIEKGARRFTSFAQAIASDLGMKVSDIRKYLRSWYNGARDMMEDLGESVVDMDGPEEVGRLIRTFDDWADKSTDLAPAPESGTSAAGNTDGLQTDLSRGDARPSPADAQRAAEDGRDGVASGQEVEGSARAPRATDVGNGQAAERPAPRSEPASGSRGAGSSDNAGLPGLNPTTGGFGLDLFDAPVRTAAPKVEKIKGQNWHIAPGALAESRGPQQKARDNIRAIEIVKDLDREGRVATAEEQEAISRYVGWGGLKNAFPDGSGAYGKGFETVGPRLRELLTDEEYETARRSIQYAHYTSETIVRNMWSLAQRLGFNGGSVFEPGMGTGNFAGMMPRDLAAKARYQGIEYDHLTSRIAHHLYPQWGVRQADYTRTPQVMDAYDLVIGNPPFSETVIQSDPAYAGKGFVLHDYFFAKSLDAVRPGGLLMFVTSAGTMNKLGTSAREYMADRAELVGAIRLPGNAFAENAGTSVTTDVIVLRKLLPGETASRAWVDTRNVSLPKKDGELKEGAVSSYFLDNPDMILGEQGFFDKLVAGGERYAVRAPSGFDLDAAMQQAAARFPVAVMRAAQSAEQKASVDFDTTTTERKDGSFYVDGDRLMQVRNGVGIPVEKRGKGVTGGISAADQERIKRLIPIRDALRDVYSADLAGDAAKSETARKALNKSYDAFVAKHGPINKADISYRRPNIIQQESARNAMREEERLAGRAWEEGSFDPARMIAEKRTTSEIARARDDARKAAQARGDAWNEGTFVPDDMPDIVIDKRPNIDAFMDDQEGYRLRAIEHYNDDTGEAKKGLVFFENVITRERPPSINSVQDALLYTLNRSGFPNIKEIADLSGKSAVEVLDELEGAIFRVPGTEDVYQTREKYLSGNVRQKLAHARQEAERDPSLRPNVTALEAVQPMPLGPVDIAANLGMPWIPADIVSEFGTNGLGLTSFKATYQSRMASWSVSGDHNSAQAKTVYGTEDREAPLLLADALNRQSPKIYRERRGPNDEKQRVLDEAATQAAQDKLAEIKARFAEWIWSDASRTERLVKHYNEEFNSLVAPTYDGSYLTTPGISSSWGWRPHQTRVIARIIQSGNTYMAHAVGAGKTSAMIGSGMEMRRLGLVKKPMYVVPNHMLGQFTKEFYEQYPTARIAVADERQFHTSRRKQFIANVASDDLDAVIITHSAFGFIPLSEDFTDGMIQDQIDEYRDLLSEIGKDQEQRFTRRRVEQQIEALEQRLSGRGNRKRDEVFTFEEMGIDFMFVDEAHLFRKLDFSTKMANVKGVDPAGSKMAFDLYAKIKYLESRTPGRSAVLASGTPITNTMAELFSLSRYLQEHELEQRNLGQFDAWAGAFGDTQTVLEQDPAGGYKPVTRFAKFVNVPELSVMVRQIMDVVTPTDLEQYVTRPQLKGGKRQMIVVEQTNRQADYQDTLKSRMEAIQKRKGPPTKGDDILLSVIGDGRKSAIDYRLINSAAPKEDSKLERMIDNAFSIWERTKRQPFHKPEAEGYSKEPVDYGPAAQMIFADFGINGDFPVHKYIASELTRRGVPKDQIAVIADYKSHVARQRLFNDMNEGKVRFLIGSVAKMGTGVNAQRRLYALHNMDAQWYPANDEQRNGRIIRQGNQNPEIEIFDYSTKGTYDSTMWGLMETKARFIEGFMRGDPTLRDMDDLGESSQYEQAKAMTTSDPRIMVLTEWKQDLEKAIRRRSAFDRNLQAVKERIDRANHRIKKNTNGIANIRKDIEQRIDISGDKFSGTVGKQSFEKRAEFGEALLARLDDLATKEQYAQPDVKVAEVGGFPIYGGATLSSDGYAAAAYIRFNGGAEVKLGGLESALGIVASIQSKVSNLESELSWAESLIEQDKKEIADFTPQLDQKFTGQPEIDDLQAKVTKLEGELAAESKKASDALQQDAGVKESRPAALEQEDTTDLEAAWADLHKRMAAVGIQDKIALRVVDAMKNRVAGTFNPRSTLQGDRIMQGVITLALTTPQNRNFTLNHEIVHAFKALGLFRTAEWQALARRATGDVVLMKSIKRRYPDLDAESQVEEAIADMFAGWVRDRSAKGLSARAFDRIQSFVGALGSWMRGQGWQSAEAVMRALDTGKLGNRPSRVRVVGKTRSSYEGAPDGLMGFSSDGSRQKGFGQNRYPIEQDVRVTLNGDTFEDTIEGLNGPHALERARRNWDGAKVEAIGEPRRVAKDSRVSDNRQPSLFSGDLNAPAGDVSVSVGTVVEMDGPLKFTAGKAWMEGKYSRPKGQWRVSDISDGHIDLDPEPGNDMGRQSMPFYMLKQMLRGKTASVVSHPMERGEKFSIIDDARDTMAVQAGKADAFKGKMADAMDRWRTAFQDRYLPLLRTQQKVEQDLGRKLRPAENPYLREELMSGRIGARLERLTEDFMDPLFEVLHQEGVSVDELETYLYARHAQERNARIAEINPAFDEGTGSGMTDIQAMAILNRVEREGMKDKLERVASYVDRIRDWSMEVRIESGLLSQDDADTWRATYENYVPLRGRAEVEGDAQGMIDRINRSGGINVRGKESRRAFGRTSRADNIIAYTLLQAEEAIVRSETNRVAQAFYKMAKQAPDDAFWKTEKVTRKPVIDKKTGLVRYEIQNHIQPQDADFTVTAKFAGKERRVTMNRDNPDAVRLADAMRNLTQHQMDWFVEHLGKVNRFLSAINTTWNPEFVITNAFRDLQTATVNLVGEERDGLVKAVLKDYPTALVASTKAAFDKGSGEWQRWHDEFVSQGGKVYFNRIDDIETLKKRVEQAAEKAANGNRVSAKALFFAARDFVENGNDGVENAIRLSTYKNARKMGMSKVEAASLAKNVTVNFNRRGTFGPAINAAYLFFNASVQGSARIITAMRSKRVRKMLAGVAAFGVAIELLNAMMSGDDDDGESYYDKISDFDKSRNLIIMMPGGKGEHIKIPLPYGYNVFYGIGRTLAEIGRRGGDRAGASMGNLATTIADAFNPLGGTESLLNFIAPTIADPVVDLSLNRDFAGNPIMPVDNPFEPPVPDAQRYFGSVAPHWRAVTDFLSMASGGDDVVAGAIDVSPETLEYLSGVVIGAAGGFADRGIGLVTKTLDPDSEIEANDIPFGRKVIGGKPTWYDRSAYYDRVEQIATAVRAAKDYQERGDTAKFEGYVDSNEKIFALEADMKAAQKEMRQIRKAKAQNILAHDQDKIDDATFRSEKRVYSDAEKIVFKRFNTRWNEVMSPKGDAGQE